MKRHPGFSKGSSNLTRQASLVNTTAHSGKSGSSVSRTRLLTNVFWRQDAESDKSVRG
jgi:hypothetical protein